ncbi:hypothetical protein ABB37_04969 [Leptomonas pyrrhocoris]|uniref:Uncharacterized protein n=1 Tax=Leptomonas pyrrhocoris TaxID=157538 RepID=A0A0M9G0W2_LEPPY|nr:hypothetical protein ABB37_04969 [Leptomonas pyrrhocoris]KPA79906.1 hypothetical protein ABB37_04969 [Leptomonas pyrrhocoris]|eukprot:XP_015658345.1 hypothetical protein ABB37_04969 [Leptomonas pyrrhocoris]
MMSSTSRTQQGTLRSHVLHISQDGNTRRYGAFVFPPSLCSRFLSSVGTRCTCGFDSGAFRFLFFFLVMSCCKRDPLFCFFLFSLFTQRNTNIPRPRLLLLLLLLLFFVLP